MKSVAAWDESPRLANGWPVGIVFLFTSYCWELSSFVLALSMQWLELSENWVANLKIVGKLILK